MWWYCFSRLSFLILSLLLWFAPMHAKVGIRSFSFMIFFCSRPVPHLLCALAVQPISYIETSAKEAVKVEGAFLEVVQMALINSAQQPPEM